MNRNGRPAHVAMGLSGRDRFGMMTSAGRCLGQNGRSSSPPMGGMSAAEGGGAAW